MLHGGFGGILGAYNGFDSLRKGSFGYFKDIFLTHLSSYTYNFGVNGFSSERCRRHRRPILNIRVGARETWKY